MGYGAPRAPAAGKDWPVYLGDAHSSQYSELKKINRRNVRRLKPAWTFHCGDARPNGRSQIQCNPLIIDGILYGTSPQLKLFALDAATGAEHWRFDPTKAGAKSTGVNRGVIYWRHPELRDDARLLYTVDHFLFAVDAATGTLIETFGRAGRVDLKDGLDRDVRRLSVMSNTPGAVFGHRLIVGTRVGEGPEPSAPGHIRAYDLRSGKLLWTFRTIPRPGELGHDTWPPDAWTYVGGANCWTGMAVDAARGLVFCPTGSPSYDFWGGDRIGQNLFGNCLLALDARTGKRKWHFQFVHHDMWDRDLPAPPNLVTVRHGGKSIDAVAQVTKSGHVFLFDRLNGKPLFPVREVPVPPSDLQGEVAWPTQPLPEKPAPFSRQLLTHDLLTDLTPESHQAALDQFYKLRPHTPFAPPSREGTVIFPGFDGGGEWGGAAVDPGAGILYVNGNEMPWILQMAETKDRGKLPVSSGQQIYNQICAACHGIERQGDAQRAMPALVDVDKRLKREEVLALLETGRGLMPSVAFLSDAQKGAVIDFLFGTESGDGEEAVGSSLGKAPYRGLGYHRWLDTNGYPVIKPPWGTLNAVNLNTGEYEWQVPLGEFKALTKQGVPPTGTENYGGPIVTAGGLVFIGASKDEMFRAFDSRNGEVLWETKLPAGGYATPSTYMAGGRQFVVIACGGGKMNTKSGDTYMAFALP